MLVIGLYWLITDRVTNGLLLLILTALIDTEELRREKIKERVLSLLKKKNEEKNG